MKSSLVKILEEISYAEIKLGKRSNQLQVNLFETVEVRDLTFNGFDSLKAYDEYCEDLLKDHQKKIDDGTRRKDDVKNILYTLNLLLQDAKSQEKRHFPKKNRDDWLVKVTFKLKYQVEFTQDEEFKLSVLRFLDVQRRLIRRCIYLINHRIHHFKSYSIKINELSVQRSTQSKLVLGNDDAPSQLTLFPNARGNTLLQWNRTKSDLLELIVALNRSNSIGSARGVVQQKDLIVFFGWLFNEDLRSANQAIGALKRRKKPESSFTLELTQVFKMYCENEF